LCIRQYFGRRQHFVNPPTFSWDANILGIRPYFLSFLGLVATCHSFFYLFYIKRAYIQYLYI
jgi:hypothetical protein